MYTGKILTSYAHTPHRQLDTVLILWYDCTHMKIPIHTNTTAPLDYSTLTLYSNNTIDT